MTFQILESSAAATITCAVCAHRVRRDVIYCTTCDTPHDPECWRFNGGCATYACRGETALSARGPSPAARVPVRAPRKRSAPAPDPMKKQLQMVEIQDQQRTAARYLLRPMLALLLIGGTVTVLFHRTGRSPAMPATPATAGTPVAPVGPPGGYRGPYALPGELPGLHEILELGQCGPAARHAIPRLLRLIERDGVLALPAAEALAKIGLTDPADARRVAELAQLTRRDEVRPALVALAMFHGTW